MSRQGGVARGDNLATDIAGANAAGLTSVWLNRFGAVRKEQDSQPDVEISSFSELTPYYLTTMALLTWMQSQRKSARLPAFSLVVGIRQFITSCMQRNQCAA